MLVFVAGQKDELGRFQKQLLLTQEGSIHEDAPAKSPFFAAVIGSFTQTADFKMGVEEAGKQMRSRSLMADDEKVVQRGHGCVIS